MFFVPKKKNAVPQKQNILQKMLEDKRAIREHFANGGKLSELPKKGFK
jgi:hypothetical protein